MLLLLLQPVRAPLEFSVDNLFIFLGGSSLETGSFSFTLSAILFVSDSDEFEEGFAWQSLVSIQPPVAIIGLGSFCDCTFCGANVSLSPPGRTSYC